MTTVKIEDLRALSYCSRGARAFFDRHGLDWSDFVSRGIDADQLSETGDAMAIAAIEQAKTREAGQ